MKLTANKPSRNPTAYELRRGFIVRLGHWIGRRSHDSRVCVTGKDTDFYPFKDCQLSSIPYNYLGNTTTTKSLAEILLAPLKRKQLSKEGAFHPGIGGYVRPSHKSLILFGLVKSHGGKYRNQNVAPKLLFQLLYKLYYL